MNTQQRRQRGARAKEIAEDAVFQEALKSMRDAIIEKWRQCDVNDTNSQHELKLMDKLIDSFAYNFQAFMDDGTMATIELEAEKEKEEQNSKLGRIYSGG